MNIDVRIDENLWNSAMAQEAVLLGWSAAPGARVTRGQKIAEILVEGARHEIIAPAAGRLADLSAAASILEPGDVLCRILES